ncbi:MAG: threonylcarbamoyl-AMP synthase [Tannerella sp.]|jgi:L-threonylcarbamoyladenylate synthase|nr:threonylcarbamoyl-AMP synthase [Tannerella sp.]
MIEEVKKACLVMREGGLILYPTDTIWGIGCDATNPAAVERVYALKRRNDSKALLVLASSEAMLETYVENVPEVAWQLIEAADKPLTIIYDKARNLAPNLIAADGSIGIRITCEAFSKALCEAFRKPVVSTSANLSGQPSPANFPEISQEIREGVDYIVDYRRDEIAKSVPSSIIKLGEGGVFKILR